MISDRALHLFYALIGAAAVYCFAQRDALTNPYVVADDTRQQIYWMEQWRDPELFQNDLLTRYSTHYVPWGVKALYAAASPLIGPLPFSKLLAGVLFVVTAGFIFGLGLRFHDRLTPVFLVCAFCFFGDFLVRIAGGLSQSFAYPILAAHLFFLSGGNLPAAATVILLASVLNPYIFLLCLVTQGLYVLHDAWNRKWPTPRSAILSAVLIGAGCVPMLLRYGLPSPVEFGPLVTRADMAGQLEYGAAGRYEIMPIPSVFQEFIRPWTINLFVPDGGAAASWILVGIGLAVIVRACRKGRQERWKADLSGFRVFADLFAASLLLYAAARVWVFRLFVPSRYVELSMTLFYCATMGVCLRQALGKAVSYRGMAFPLLTTILLALGACRLRNVGVYDYSAQAPLYNFFRSTPKTSLVAGHPDVMDNVLTFGQRKAFVAYELSHTWYTAYWKEIRKRTFDFFRSYYAEDPVEVRQFCSANGIDYLVIRDSDFSREWRTGGKAYFEPFGGFIRDLTASRSRFALLDRNAFPTVFEMNGLRVIRMRDPRGSARQMRP